MEARLSPRGVPVCRARRVPRRHSRIHPGWARRRRADPRGRERREDRPAARELGADAEQVQFADMAEVGRNPARIIPAWSDFVDERADPSRPLRGIGEPIGPDRGPAELVECQRHEMLLNLAFEDTPAFWLMCPYDTDALDPARGGRGVAQPPGRLGRQRPRGQHAPTVVVAAAAAPFREPLRDPPDAAEGVLLRGCRPRGAAPVRGPARRGRGARRPFAQRTSC